MQSITISRRTVQVVSHHGEFHFIIRRKRGFLTGQIQRHTLWHKIFDVEIPHPVLVIARVGANMPHTGCRIAIEWPGKVVEAILRLTNDAPEYLPVRFNHV